MALKVKERSGTNAVRILRKSKLNRGQPFMINSRALPSTQCYLEYPDGSIKLVTLTSAQTDLKVIRDLSPEETASLRKRFNLI